MIEIKVLSKAGPVFLANVAKLNDLGIPVGGTVTNLDGTAMVQPNSCYSVSAIGYETNSFCIGNEGTFIELVEKTYSLGEFTVTAPKPKTWIYIAIAAIVITVAVILYKNR